MAPWFQLAAIEKILVPIPGYRPSSDINGTVKVKPASICEIGSQSKDILATMLG